MAMQSNPNASVRPKLTLPSQNLSLKPLVQISAVTKSKTSPSSLSCSSFNFGRNPVGIAAVKLRISASFPSIDPVVSDELPALGSTEVTSSRKKKKLGVVVKPLQKPKLVLKFIWMQKDIGIALDQMIPGYGTIPLSPYHFWPRKDAWEEVKVLLESKPWISQMQRIHLLNQATDLINLWQTSGGDLP